MNKKLISIEFHKNKNKDEPKFIGSISLQDLMKDGIRRDNLNSQTKKAASNYEKSIQECKVIIDKIKKGASINQAFLRDMWSLGSKIRSFTNSLKKDGFYLNGLYEHLTRDLQVSRNLLEKVVIFRSYFSNRSLIPNNMLWREIRYAPRKNAEKLKKTLLNKETKQK